MSKIVLIDQLKACAQQSKTYFTGIIGEITGTVADALQELDDTKMNQDLYGVAAGVATLNANGQLSEGQRWEYEIDAYTKDEVDSLITTSISTHNSDTTAHPTINTTVSSFEARIVALEMKHTDISDNVFTVTFETLDDVTVTGVWNEANARCDF